jgi:light-regulated signal transduction histidine kinase (bacteriophytochrome)
MPQVWVDAERVGLMVLNMALNAIDQAEDGLGVVRLQTRAAGTEFQISVSDNAIAYSCELQEQIFTPHETHKQRFSNGIGMMLARQIACGHGGRITLDCRDGANTLTATLPVKAGGQEPQ